MNFIKETDKELEQLGLKILLISEKLELPFDEGIKSFVYNMIKELSKGYNVFALSIRGNKTDERYIKSLNVNKTFLSFTLFREIREFNPEVILYVPSPSATLYSFMRTRVLKLYVKKAKIIMIALQPREYSYMSRKIIPFLIPDLVLVQSPSVLEQLTKLGCRVKFIPNGVDLETFYPVSTENKSKLRSKYGIDVDKFVILHVGHINRNRNIQILRELQTEDNLVLVVGSTSTEQDRDLDDELEKAGVKVITDYLENIEEIYQLSDCYIFPVTSETASIEIPLSVLEAMACNLPIITTRYGGLHSIFSSEGKGFFYVNDLNNLSDKINEVKKINYCETRRMVEPYSWGTIAKRVLDLVSSTK